MIDFVRNRWRQQTHSERKIFFVGFNKCGTTAIHWFLIRHGLKSVHWRHRHGNLALSIENLTEKPGQLRGFLSRWTAFSDITQSDPERMIDGNWHFRLFHELFPEAYFVLNDRDVDAWIKSRCSHRHGQFLENAMAYHGLGRNDVIAKWREDYERLVSEVTAHFANHPRFLHYRIDRDEVSALTDFLSPDYRLNPARWRLSNTTRGNPAASRHSL